jgi:hypothetical protein
MNPFAQLSVNTTKGLAAIMAGRAVVDGNQEKVAWDQSGISVDRNTLTIDGTVFELVELATDSTFDIGTDWNNTNAWVSQTHASHSFTVGQFVAVNNEVARVGYVSGDNVAFERQGFAGTTVAAHPTGTDPINVQGGTALTAGAVTVPLAGAGVSAEITIDAVDAIIAAREWLGRNGQDNFKWDILKLSASRALIHSTAVGARSATFAEALTNGTLSGTTGEGGSAHGSMMVKNVYRAPTADEVTDGNIYVICPFKPVNVLVTVFNDAAGTTKAWDGATVIDQAANVVSIDNSGATDWDATDFVAITVMGEPLVGEELVSE